MSKWITAFLINSTKDTGNNDWDIIRFVLASLIIKRVIENTKDISIRKRKAFHICQLKYLRFSLLDIKCRVIATDIFDSISLCYFINFKKILSLIPISATVWVIFGITCTVNVKVNVCSIYRFYNLFIKSISLPNLNACFADAFSYLTTSKPHSHSIFYFYFFLQYVLTNVLFLPEIFLTGIGL